MHKKESEVYYTKYQSQNRSNDKLIRPFYKWKDGFFENYLKYYNPEGLARRAKRVKLPYQIEEEEMRLLKEGGGALTPMLDSGAHGKVLSEAIINKELS